MNVNDGRLTGTIKCKQRCLKTQGGLITQDTLMEVLEKLFNKNKIIPPSWNNSHCRGPRILKNKIAKTIYKYRVEKIWRFIQI